MVVVLDDHGCGLEGEDKLDPDQEQEVGDHLADHELLLLLLHDLVVEDEDVCSDSQLP